MAEGLGIAAEDVCRQLHYGPLVREAAAASGNDPIATVVVWRMCAGFSHGRRWASFAYLHRLTVAQTGNVKTVTIGTTLDALAWPLLAANAMTMTGRDLYEARRRSRL